MITFEHVSKRFDSRRVLDDLSVTIEKGEIFVFVGPSGTGKSVTLKHMVRLLTPDEGVVRLEDTLVSQAEGRELQALRRRFGYLFQSGALLAWMNVAENIALPLCEDLGLPESEIDARVVDALKMVGLSDEGSNMPNALSGGMQKRVALARAIVTQPEIVLYDEPTSGLDPVTARLIDRLIQKMNRDLGVTSIVVTHDLHSALSIGSRIAMLNDGNIRELATPEQFIQSEVPVVKQFLESQFITRSGAWEE